MRTLGIEQGLWVVDARNTRPTTRVTRVISLARQRLDVIQRHRLDVEDATQVSQEGASTAHTVFLVVFTAGPVA